MISKIKISNLLFLVAVLTGFIFTYPSDTVDAATSNTSYTEIKKIPSELYGSWKYQGSASKNGSINIVKTVVGSVNSAKYSLYDSDKNGYTNQTWRVAGINKIYKIDDDNYKITLSDFENPKAVDNAKNIDINIKFVSKNKIQMNYFESYGSGTSNTEKIKTDKSYTLKLIRHTSGVDIT